MAYSPPTKKVDPSQVGVNYHLALGTSSTIGAANDRIYGYNLVPDSKMGILRQQTDLQAKNKLTSYSSELLIDRDFVNWPRVTDGDFSGGALQQVYLDTTRCWDADLDLRVPGQVFLHPAWQRTGTLASGLGSVMPQVLSFNGSAYVTFQGTSIYKQDGTTIGSSGITNSLICTDDGSIYASDGVNNIKSTSDLSSWTSLTTTSGTIKQMWIVNQGTSGRFLYFTADNRALQKQDLNVAWAPVSVPTASQAFTIVDISPYLAGVAILTQPLDSARAFDVWYHDGANMTRIIRAEGYYPTGMCNGLGQLYITATDSGGNGIPVLLRIGAGSFDIVARTSVPLVASNNPLTPWWTRPFNLHLGGTQTPTVGAPVNIHHYIYFAVTNPQVNGISAASYIGAYDVLNGAYWHLPNLNTTDVPPDTLRALAVVGRSVVFPMIASGNGTLQYQVNNQNLAVSGSPKPVYQATGWLVSSRIDFNTPGISKQFRRVIVHHKALATGESIVVKGFVDLEPINFTTSSTATATVTGSTVGSNNTVLTFPAATQGHSMYFAVQLNGGGTGNNQTTPIFYYASVEISTPWGFEFTVDATSKRQMLSGAPDNQGVMGKDLWYLLKLAWEQGQTVTYYDSDGSNYVCTIERLERFNPSPQFQATPLKAQDIESWLSVVLRVTNEN